LKQLPKTWLQHLFLVIHPFPTRCLILVGWGTAAEEFQHDRADVANLVPSARRNRNRVPRADRADLVADLHRAVTFQDVVDLFRSGMIVGRGGSVDRKPRIGQRLVANIRIPMGQQFTNLRAVLGSEGRHAIDIGNVRGCLLKTNMTSSQVWSWILNLHPTAAADPVAKLKQRGFELRSTT